MDLAVEKGHGRAFSKPCQSVGNHAGLRYSVQRHEAVLTLIQVETAMLVGVIVARRVIEDA